MNIEQITEIDALLLRYIDALDGKDMTRWLETFAEEDEASYICLSRENVDHGHAIGFMYDDCRARLYDRVTFVTEIWKGTFQDYRTRHFVQRLVIDPIDSTSVKVRSNFTVIMAPEDSGVAEILTAGVYDDVIRVGEGAPRILSRKAILDTAALPRYLVYPI